MTDEELELALREWGALSKYEAERREGATDFHVLSRARDFAPGTRERAARQIAGRDGKERRAYMARDLAACGVRVVPMAYVDPVRAQDSHRVGPRERIGDSIPAHLKRLHYATLELHRMDTLRGLVLRQEYCGYGSQTEKAERVGMAYGSRIGLRIYRESLAHAKGWMLAVLSA